MKVLDEIFAGYGYKPKRRSGELGMEIETETASIGAYPKDFFVPDGADDKGVPKYKVPQLPKWKAMGDGSLRNFGMEYIFKEPYSYKEAIQAIDIFGENTKGVKFIKDAPATSVHVHINMWSETLVTLGNFCTNYTLFENTLVEFAGEMRRSNLFSLPTRCAETTGWNIIKMFEGIEKGDWRALKFSDEEVKYAALNLASLCRLGSLEVRMMRGTTDPKELKAWVTILYRLLNFSRTEGLTPRTVISEYKHKGLDFFDEVFEGEAHLLRKACGGNLEALIDKNLYFAGCIATSVKNWNTLQDCILSREEYDKQQKDDLVAAKKKLVMKKLGGNGGDAFQQAQALANQIAAGQNNLNDNLNDFWAPPPQPVNNPAPVLQPGWVIQDEAADINF